MQPPVYTIKLHQIVGKSAVSRRLTQLGFWRSNNRAPDKTQLASPRVSSVVTVTRHARTQNEALCLQWAHSTGTKSAAPPFATTRHQWGKTNLSHDGLNPGQNT